MECELCCFTALATLYFIIASNATKNIVRRKDLTGSLTFIAVMESDFPHMQKTDQICNQLQIIRFFILRHIPSHENYLTKVLEVPVSMTSLAELSEILTMFSTATFV